MTVAELMERLSKLPPDLQVILQKDAEGNGYSPLSEVDANAVYVPDNTWSGSVYSTTWTADDAGMDEDDWQELLNGPRCCVLAPVN